MKVEGMGNTRTIPFKSIFEVDQVGSYSNVGSEYKIIDGPLKAQEIDGPRKP